MKQFEDFWEPSASPAPGATLKKLAALERQLGRKLPPPLTRLLKMQNGGKVRYEDMYLLPADATGDVSIASVDHVFSDMPELLELVEEIAGDPENLLLFAVDSTGHDYFALDYALEPRSRDPFLVQIDAECVECDPLEMRLSEFLEDLTHADDAAEVDWEQSEHYPCIFRETLSIEEHGRTLRVEQKLCELPDALLLFGRESDLSGVALHLSEISLPLNADACSIFRVPSSAGAIYRLMLAPAVEAEELESTDQEADSDGFPEADYYAPAPVAWSRSVLRADGRWKNSSGSDSLASFDSGIRERLVELRRELIGGEIGEPLQVLEEMDLLMENPDQGEAGRALPGLILKFTECMRNKLKSQPAEQAKTTAAVIDRLSEFAQQTQRDWEEKSDESGDLPELIEAMHLLLESLPYSER